MAQPNIVETGPYYAPKAALAYRRAALACSGMLMVLGFGVLLGWSLHIDALMSVLPNHNRMKPNVAFAFLMLGVGLLTALVPSGRSGYVPKVLAAIVGVLGVSATLEYLFHVNLWIDQALYADPTQHVYPGRMAPITALTLILAAVSLFALHGGRRVRALSQVAALLIAASAFVAVVGGIYGISFFYGSLVYTSMALHTGAGFLILSAALILAQREFRLLKVLGAPGSGGRIARVALPVAIVMPILLGYATLQSATTFLRLRLGMALFALALVAAGTLTVCYIAFFITRVEEERRELAEAERRRVEDDQARNEQALRKSEEFLDRSGRLAGIGGWELNLLTNEFVWSSQARRVFGVEADYSPSLDSMIACYVKEAQPVLRDALAASVAGGTGWDLEQQVLRPDGHSIWVRSVGYAECSDGEPTRLIGSIHDVTARVVGETARREVTERLTMATESGGIGIWDLDLVSRHMVWDQRTYELYGMRETEAPENLYAACTRRLHPADLAPTLQTFQLAITNRTPWRTSFRVIWDDSSVHYIQVSGKVTYDLSDSPVRAVGTSRDITERMRADLVLQDQARLLDLSHDAILVRSLTGEILFWNQGAAEMYGFAKQEALGFISHDLLGTVFPASPSEIEEELLRRNRWEGELVHKTRAGTSLIVASRWVLQRDIEGQASSVIEIYDNITERKHAEKELRRNDKNMRLLFAGIKDYAIYMLDLSGMIVTWNEGAENIFGYQAEEIIGKSVQCFYTPEATAIGLHTQTLALVRQRGRTEETAWRVRKDGSRFWANVVMTSLHDENGTLNGFVKVTRDITERKNAEAALLKAGALQRAAMQKAEHANRTKSEFLANMSHEIRTPMNAIMGMTYLALRAEPDPSQKTYLTKIGNAAESLLNIINDILDFSKMEAGRLELEHLPFLLSDVLDNVRNVTAQKAQAKNIALLFPQMRKTPQYLQGDALRLGQVLINLVSNAVKFTRVGSVIVKVLTKEEMEGSVVVHFSVADTGIGMSAEQVSRLFQSFRQADASVTREYGGTGLGLAISKQICELMNGTLSVESEFGSGSTFHFTAIFDKAISAPPLVNCDLPGHTTNKALPAINDDPCTPVRSPADLAGRRVLLVEDNEINCDLAVELLGNLDMAVTIAKNGREGVVRVTEESFDLVLMDIQMPVMDGLSAARIIRKDGRFMDLPIIAMTANAMSGDREKSLGAGMNDHITKPIHPEALVNTLLRWIPGGQVRRPQSDAVLASPGAPEDLPDDLPPFDMQAALARTMGNGKLLRKMLLAFRERYDDAGDQVRALLARGKVGDAQRLVHSLKSVAATLEARELAHAADALESELRLGGIDRLPTLVDRLERAQQSASSAVALLDDTRPRALPRPESSPAMRDCQA